MIWGRNSETAWNLRRDPRVHNYRVKWVSIIQNARESVVWNTENRFFLFFVYLKAIKLEKLIISVHTH